VNIELSDGSTVQDDDNVSVIANDFLAFGGDGIFTPIIPEAGYAIDEQQPLVRDVLVDWFRGQDGSMNPEDFSTSAKPKWNLPDPMPATCAF
ncbi:MAG: hypothetical protein WBM34_14440, partial [Woeseiaceae bacterium]